MIAYILKECIFKNIEERKLDGRRNFKKDFWN